MRIWFLRMLIFVFALAAFAAAAAPQGQIP
jgi:hypothetical protein